MVLFGSGRKFHILFGSTSEIDYITLENVATFRATYFIANSILPINFLSEHRASI